MAILLITFALKLVFYPLSEASGKSMAKMRALQPRIKNIQEQYKDDKEKLGRATMELYQREKVNPVSGCLPMIVQIRCSSPSTYSWKAWRCARRPLRCG